jgi:hypothetical protein
MRPGSNAIDVATVSQKCNGLLIREDHPGRIQLGQAALFPSDRNLPKRLELYAPVTGQFIMCMRIPSRYTHGRQLHAIVDLSRKLGYSC